MSIVICREMYLLKYFRKLYSVFLYVKITLLLYCHKPPPPRKNNKISLKNKTICFPLTHTIKNSQIENC